MNLLQFFKDEKGNLSMMRLIAFILVINASLLSWQKPTDNDLIGMLLIPATGSKLGQKIVEMYFDKKSNVQT